MSFPRYEKYKDSGVEWLGNVPSHWTVVPLKFIATVQTGIAKGKDYAGKDTIEVPYLRVANVQDGYLALDDMAVLNIPATDLPRYLLRAGDVLMNEGGDFDKLGRGHVWRAEVEPCIHQNHVFAVRPHEDVSSEWLNCVTGSKYAQFYFMTRSKQSTNLASISSTNIMELPVTLPPESERWAILTFLDRETAKIDGLIAEQRRLIDLLKEKCLAVASHVISKGLNPDTPMKRSGVQGLGQIPSHWTVVPLKFVAAVQTGVAKGKDNTGKEVIEVPYLRVANVQDGYLALDDMAVIEIPVADLQRYLLRAGDVLMNEGGDYDKLGRGHIWQAEIDPCIHQNHVFAVRPHGVSPKWLNTITGSAYGQFYFMSRSKQSTNLASISSTNIMELPVVLPPKAEQTKILRFLARQTKELEALAQEARAAIELLQERRSALIAAAVTGQIDVRGTAPASAVAEDWNTVHATIGSFADEHSTL